MREVDEQAARLLAGDATLGAVQVLALEDLCDFGAKWGAALAEHWATPRQRQRGEMNYAVFQCVRSALSGPLRAATAKYGSARYW